MNDYRIVYRPGGSRRQSPIAGPVLAISRGETIAAVDIDSVGPNGENAVLKVIKNPKPADREMLLVAAATAITWAQAGAEIIFAASGPENACERELIEHFGGGQLSIFDMLRNGMHGFKAPPADSVVIMPVRPNLASAVFLASIEYVDIPVLRTPWFRAVATKFALEGTPLPNRILMARRTKH